MNLKRSCLVGLVLAELVRELFHYLLLNYLFRVDLKIELSLASLRGVWVSYTQLTNPCKQKYVGYWRVFVLVGLCLKLVKNYIFLRCQTIHCLAWKLKFFCTDPKNRNPNKILTILGMLKLSQQQTRLVLKKWHGLVISTLGFNSGGPRIRFPSRLGCTPPHLLFFHICWIL